MDLTEEKLEIAGGNELRKNWTLPDGMNCGKTGHYRTDWTTKKNWKLPDGLN